MAEMQGIEFQVVGNASQAVRELTSLADTLERVKDAAKNIHTGKANKEITSLRNSAAKTTSALSKLGAAFKRIVFYRAIRSAIKAITDAFKEGLKNAYQFSKLTGDQAKLAESLDTISTKGLTMKNQLGAAFGGLLTAITPIVLQIINLVTKLAEAISRLFAIFGNGTYLKAKDVWTEWGDAAAGAGGAAKKALEYLAPFDELNVLPDPKSGGGGGAAANFGDMFEYASVDGGIGDVLSGWLSSITEFFTTTDWAGLVDEVWTKLKEAFSDEGEATKVIESLFTALGAALGASITVVVAFGDKVYENIIEQLKKDRNLDGKLTVDEILTNVIDVVTFKTIKQWAIDHIVTPLFQGLAEGLKPGSSQNQGSFHSGIEWFVVDVLGMPTDEEWKTCGKNALAWLKDGFEEAINETSFAFTGLSFEDFKDKLALASVWFEDNFFRGIVQAGIDAINGMLKGFENSINEFIQNHPKIAKWLGIEEPISITMIPDLDPPVGEFYEEKKREIEAKSNADPIIVKGGAEITSAMDNIPQLMKMTTGWTAQHELTSRKWASGQSWTTTGWWAQHEKTSRKWASGLSWTTTGWWAQHEKTSRKWQSGLSWTTTGWTAQFNKYSLDSKLKDSNGYLKVNSVVDIKGQTNVPTIKVNAQYSNQPRALGGAFYNGAWHDIPQYAAGGRVHGSLFLAGEAGAEVVGHVGGRTEVLNRSQLAATMYAAVRGAMSGVRVQTTAPGYQDDDITNEDMMYRAFSRALSETDNVIELDGDVVYRKVVQRNRLNTRSTGVNAMA